MPGRDSDRLQHLRRLLPCEVRVTSTVHPLFGRLLPATGFKRCDGSLFLVVGLPDGSPGTIPVSATDILGDEPVVELADGAVGGGDPRAADAGRLDEADAAVPVSSPKTRK